MRPSELAHMHFDSAHSSNGPTSQNMPDGLQNPLNFMIQGLDAMNTGLRATYMKLEQIEALLKAQGVGPSSLLFASVLTALGFPRSRTCHLAVSRVAIRRRALTT
jgi:hypothetical protein